MKAQIPLLLVWLALATTAPSQGNPCFAGTQLQNDSLPTNPAGSQNVAVIQGLCVGDSAASVFDVSAFGPTVDVLEGGILFAGPAGSAPASGRLQIYDGLTIAANGAVTIGPLAYTSPVVTYLPNALTFVMPPAPVTVTSGTLVVAFTMDTNPNELFPGLGCVLGYTADFASDTTLPAGSPCNSPPGVNLIFDPAQGWWDIAQFQIGGTPWCGGSYNGNWVIRACVNGTVLPPATHPGTGEDLVMTTAVNAGALDAVDVKPVTAGDVVTVFVDSPGGTFDGVQLLVGAQLFATGSPPAGIFPGVVLNTNAILVIGGPSGPFGPVLLPAQGLASSFFVPSGIAGNSALFQGVVPTPAAANGALATTDGFEFQVM